MKDQDDWKEIVLNYRPQRNNLESIKVFFEEGKKGKAIIFATPEGNFLSPKAVKNLLSSQARELKERMKEKDHAFVLMYQCLEDVVSQYGGDCISTSEHAEWLVEKFKHLSAIESIEI